MAKRVTDEDRDLLEELGEDTDATITGGRTPREQRILAGFEEIERFVDEHCRAPQHGEDRDIFERIYAVRLDRIRASAECRGVLKDFDKHGLLQGETEGEFAPELENASDEDLLAAVDVELEGDDVTKLVHVRSREEINAAEEVARRTPCLDFAKFKPIFDKVQHELDRGIRKTIKYGKNTEIKEGDLFVIEGQKVLVAEIIARFKSFGPNGRLRAIYDNGTENNLLIRSLQNALYKDEAGRRITEPDNHPLFSDEIEEGDSETGYIYVLRSKSENDYVAKYRTVLHKIGVTGGEVKSRVANAKKDPTYLLAEVDIVATFKLVNINRKNLENLLHKFFAGARLDVQLKDRFGSNVEPREWFLVPYPAIEDAVDKIKAGTILNYRFDVESAKIVPL